MTVVNKEQTIELLTNFNIPIEIGLQFVENGFALLYELREWIDCYNSGSIHTNSIDILARWRDEQFTAPQCYYWGVTHNLSLEQAIEWRQGGADAPQAFKWMQQGMRPSDYSKWKSLPIWDDDLSTFLSFNLTPDDVTPWLYDGVIEAYNVTAQQIAEWIVEGRFPEDVPSLLNSQ